MELATASHVGLDEVEGILLHHLHVGIWDRKLCHVYILYTHTHTHTHTQQLRVL